LWKENTIIAAEVFLTVKIPKGAGCDEIRSVIFKALNKKVLCPTRVHDDLGGL